MMAEIKRYFRSFLMHRLRTFLSTLGILFGVAAVITMLSIGEGAKQETLEQIEQLGMNSILIRRHLISEEQRTQPLERHSKGLSLEDGEALKQNLPMLAHYALLKVVDAFLTGSLSHLSPEIIAVTRSYGEMKKLSLAEGRFICDLDVQGRRRVCVAGNEAAKNLGAGGHLGGMLRIGKEEYEIVGVLKSTHWKEGKNHGITMRNIDKTLFIPFGSHSKLTQAKGSENEALSEIILQIQDSKQMGAAASLVKRILEQLHGSNEDYQIVVPQELQRQAYRTQRTFNLILGSIAAISLLVGGIGIMNIMLASVSERTREIGIRRAVGANQRHILKQFLLEALLLTLIGAFLGIVLGITLSTAISSIAGWRTIVTLWSVLLSLIMSLTVGICSGLYPAYQAAMMDPIKTLRHH